MSLQISHELWPAGGYLLRQYQHFLRDVSVGKRWSRLRVLNTSKRTNFRQLGARGQSRDDLPPGQNQYNPQMLKARGTHRETNEPIFLVGLTQENLHQLVQKHPITFDGKEIGLNGSVVIFFSETEETALAEFAEAGITLPER